MMAVNKIKEIAISTNEANRRETLSKLAATAMTSKLIKRNTTFFTKSKLTTVPEFVDGANVPQWLSTQFYPSTKTISTRS